VRSFIVLVVAVLVLSVPALAFHPTTTSCNRCHIVHNAQGADNMPLWSGATIATSFVLYGSDTLDAEPGEPEGATLLCLSCHDTSRTTSHAMNTAEGDLSRTHPIEFVYDNNLDDELKDPASATVTRTAGGGGTILEELLTADGTMNCSSCHDVHVQGLHGTQLSGLPAPPTDDDDYDIPHLQDIDGVEYKLGRNADPNLFNSYSLSYGKLCVTCHIK